ncbi:MAG: rhomboid family intramembrane serine protease [Rhodopirellula sp.]|nr:rhomboid family intramembrane serine protease [Rhodopirellula sp.]
MNEFQETPVSPTDSSVTFARTLNAVTPRVIATPSLIAVNVAIFGAMVASGVHPISPITRDLANWGANFGPMTLNGQWWRLVTSMFLHGGIVHLAMNMFFLWYIGRLVERLVGNVGFLVLYFVSGIAGSMTSLAWKPEVFSVGASGAIFGVLGALLGFIILRRDSIPDTVFGQLRHSVLALIGYNVLFGMMVPGIDMAAHAGGFIAGFLCGLILSQPLSLEAVAARWQRNAAVLLVGAVLLPLAAAALPEAPPDMEQELQRLMDLEKQVNKTMSKLVTQLQQEEISAAEFADAVQHDVIFPWADTRRSIEGLLDKPHTDRAFLSRLAEYMKLREESWQLQAEGVRERDSEKMERGMKKNSAAGEIVREMSSR